jgi:hypothetical protein
MGHRRAPETKLLPISALQVDSAIEVDALYVELLKKAERAKLMIGLTRLSLIELTPGFFQRSAGRTEHISNLEELQAAVPGAAEKIRSGWRPSLDVYWSPLAPNGGGYVCPDDEVTFEAYRVLNIQAVPCRVLQPKVVSASEGVIWIEKTGQGIDLNREVAPACPQRYAGLRISSRASFGDSCSKMIGACRAIQSGVKRFHRQSLSSDPHYHQMLYAAVSRHIRLLETIQLLVEEDRIEHAGAIARLGYEAFLNFYLDWLSPEFVGPRFQLLAIVREEGRDPALLSSFVKLVGLFENTTRKARLGPLGEHFHDKTYPALSLIAHQSYAYLEREASGFGRGTPKPVKGARRQLAVRLNILTTAFLTRVANEVGLAWPDRQAA